MPFLEDPEELSLPITALAIEIHTADVRRADTEAGVYCNVVFKDGSLLFSHLNHELNRHAPPDFQRGQTTTYLLPLPAEGFDKRIGDIAEFYLRKDHDKHGGWLLGGALLFANDLLTPVMGNNQINEFLDNEAHTLFRCDWSPRSLSASGNVPAEFPLLAPSYRIAGPILGQLSDTSATILYRLDQEGTYRLKVFKVPPAQPAVPVFDDVAPLSPTHRFEVNNLQSDTQYRFSFWRVFGGEELPVPQRGWRVANLPVRGRGRSVQFCVRLLCQ